MLYLVIDEKRNETLVKIGRTDDLKQRMRSYYTTNPNAEFVGMLKIHHKDKEAEKDFQFEMMCLGFKRIYNTEWFSVPAEVGDFMRTYGFNCFKNLLSHYHVVSYTLQETKHCKPKMNFETFVKKIMRFA